MKKLILIILLMSTICYGANEIRAFYASGNTLNAVIRNSSGQADIITTNTFEDWSDFNDYKISMTDKSGGMYLCNFDSNLPADFYTVIIYKIETPIMFEEGYWTGTVWQSTSKQLEDIITDTGTTIPALINDVNDNLETAIGNITVDNGAIADEVVLHMDANSTQLAAIVEDTNEVQTDWTDGGRLDTILDDIKSYILKLLDRIF